MVVEALRSESLSALTVKFVSNVDPIHMQQTLERSNPETTIFIVASKSFTTAETLANANNARRWLLNSGCATDHLNHHFVAVSSNVATRSRSASPRKISIRCGTGWAGAIRCGLQSAYRLHW